MKLTNNEAEADKYLRRNNVCMEYGVSPSAFAGIPESFHSRHIYSKNCILTVGNAHMCRHMLNGSPSHSILLYGRLGTVPLYDTTGFHGTAYVVTSIVVSRHMHS
jgi:hypothetical protein